MLIRRVRLGGRRASSIVNRVIGRSSAPSKRATPTAAPSSSFRRRGNTISMAIEMVFPLLRKELDGAAVGVARFEGALDRPITRFTIELARLPPNLTRRMSIGVRHERVAIQLREPPVHGRIGREPRLEREDVFRQIAIAFLDGIEAAF